MKLWALNVCVACILAGALDLFLPRQGSFKSIKTVLALYILVSVVTPAAGADWTGLASLSFESSPPITRITSPATPARALPGSWKNGLRPPASRRR